MASSCLFVMVALDVARGEEYISDNGVLCGRGFNQLYQEERTSGRVGICSFAWGSTTVLPAFEDRRLKRGCRAQFPKAIG